MNRRVALVVLAAVVLAAGTAGALALTVGGASAPETAENPSLGAGNGTLEVHYLNVGQGDATLVVTPANETLLIDSGDWRDDGELVLDYLERQNVTRLDYLVTSHADADHIGGHAAVIEYFETEADGVGAVYDPGVAASTATYDRYLDAVERHNVTLYEARRNDTIPVANATIESLAPPRDALLANGDRDENSLALDVRLGNTSVLFTGDAGSAGEEFLVETDGEEVDERADEATGATVLQAGHHGSNTSSGAGFLDAVTPQVVVISSAHDSQFGHPHDQVLRRLADREVPTYWTATHGDVVVRTDGHNVSVATQRDAPTDASRLREGDAVAPGNRTTAEHRSQFTANDSLTVDSGTAIATDGGTVGTATRMEAATRTETATATQTQPSTGATGDVPLELAAINADASGDDRDNLNDESLVFENAGDDPLDLAGWQVTDEAGHTYTFPAGVVLDPGGRVTLHTGSGTDTETDLYWGSGQPVWNNDGDTVIVTTADGEGVLEEAY